MASDEPPARGAAWIEPLQLDFGDQDVRRAVKVDDVAPPAAAGPRHLGGIDEHRIDTEPAHANIIDRALRGPEFGPRALPRVAELDAGRRARSHGDGDQEHRRRALHLSARDAEELRRFRSVELDAE